MAFFLRSRINLERHERITPIHFCIFLFISHSFARPGLLEQICDEKSRPRGAGPSSQPAEETAAAAGLLSSTFSSWGKKFNSAIDSGKAKVLFARNVFHPSLTTASD